MKLVCVFLLCAAGVACADGTNYWIERYPGDGMKQLPKRTSPRKEPAISRDIAEIGPSSTNTVANTNATTAARFIVPRVASKDFAPSRLPEPKAKAVVMPKRKHKLPPSPKVSDKIGREEKAEAQVSESPAPGTNSPPPAASTQ